MNGDEAHGDLPRTAYTLPLCEGAPMKVPGGLFHRCGRHEYCKGHCVRHMERRMEIVLNLLGLTQLLYKYST